MPTHPTAYPDASTQMNEASALRTLNSFAVDLIGIPSAEELFWYVARNVVGRLNFVDCVIYQANEAQTELRQVAAWGEKNPYGRNIINPLVIPFGRGITGQVAESKEALVVHDLLKDQNYIPDTQVSRSEICVPVLFQGRVVGVIDSEHPRPDAFGEADLEILSTVAAMTGAKLELLAAEERAKQRYQDLVASHAQLTEEVSARKALEASLFEARRREGLGRLTGRFAHEFNNILTVILGNLELLETMGAGPEASEFLKEAKAAGERGSRLMRDMLVFAQRTRLEPEVLELNRVINDFQVAYGSGNASGIGLALEEQLWPVVADRKGMEGLLFNLIENARDAIAAGGQIEIRTENALLTHSSELGLSHDLPAGKYVCLTVSDTGSGIADGLQPQIFDPFFTTKDVGAGTGLGLSIVSGFARQSGGAVCCQSEVGEGTSFKVFLPASSETGKDLLTNPK